MKPGQLNSGRRAPAVRQSASPLPQGACRFRRATHAAGRSPTHLYFVSLKHAQSDVEQARCHLTATYQSYTEMEATWFVDRTLAMADELGIRLRGPR
jgi:hypothetical protein